MLKLLLARSIHYLSSHAFPPLPPRHSRTGGAQTDEKLPQAVEEAGHSRAKHTAVCLAGSRTKPQSGSARGLHRENISTPSKSPQAWVGGLGTPKRCVLETGWVD